MKLLVATRNAGKRREFGVLLRDILPTGTEVVDVAAWPEPVPEVVEDGDTFVANALKKAIETAQHTGATSIADDSGLEVDALGGRPGVYSARYAGANANDDANNALLVEELAEVAPAERSARYVCVVALCLGEDELGSALRPDTIGENLPGQWFEHDGHTVIWTRATCEGRIIDAPRGTNGFGYDPHFLIDDWGQTMAEVTLERKNERSHRAAAVRSLAKAITSTGD